ncbi:MAG: hypothetical protein AMXMBFR56_22790 [Polyangiaceae bacterium]
MSLMVPEPRVRYDRAVRLWLSATALGLACSGSPAASGPPLSPPPAAKVPAPAPTPAPSPDPPPPSAPTAEAPQPLPETACRPLRLAKACVSQASQDWLDSEALASWYQSRGTKPPQGIEPSCREIVLGSGSEAALWCERIQHESRGKPGTPLHTYRVLTLLSVRAVRSKRVEVLLEAPLRFDVLDKEDLEQGPAFELAVEARSPLTELVLGEPSDGACDEAEAELRRRRAANDPSQVAWARLDEELRARLCRAIGKYVLKGGRLQRVAPKTTASSSSGP